MRRRNIAVPGAGMLKHPGVFPDSGVQVIPFDGLSNAFAVKGEVPALWFLRARPRHGKPGSTQHKLHQQYPFSDG
jgi:hypothetical protein